MGANTHGMTWPSRRLPDFRRLWRKPPERRQVNLIETVPAGKRLTKSGEHGLDDNLAQRTPKDRTRSAAIASSKRMADGKEWTTANLNVKTLW